jgi:hypothetical protein
VTLAPIDRSWLPLSENLDHHPKKKTKRSAERCVWRYSFSSRGLKLSNSKPGCRFSALHFVVK